MLKRNVVVASITMACVAAGAPSAAASAEPAASDGTWLYLKTPLPGMPSSCPDAQAAGAGLVKVSLFAERSGSCPVASVDGTEAATVDDLVAALAGSHEGHAGSARAGRQDATALVQRLVDARLVVMEAQAMGMEDLPETKRSFAEIDEATGREILKERVLRDVKADPAVTRRLFEEKVREWKLQSVLFVREDDAVAASREIRKGKKFDDVAARAVAAKKARGNEPGQFVPGSQLILPVLGAVQATPVGKTTAPVKVPGGWALIEVEAIRHPDDPKARAEAESAALLEARKEALRRYHDGVVKRFATIDEPLLKSLDFEAPQPGFEALRKDRRVLATIQGGKTITVADLAQSLAEQFFHGVQNATQGRRLNTAKGPALDALVSPKVVALEVARLGIDKSEEYRRRTEAAKNATVFGAFVQKVVVPNVKIDEKAVRAHYEAHRADYTGGAFYRVESIGFGSQKAAEAAVAKLRAGTDFKWLNANAEGKLPEGKDTERPAGVLSSKGMTPAFARVVEGTRPGDVRVFAAPGNQFYAVHVLSVTPPTTQPYEEVREAIFQKLHGQAVQASIEDWMARLRKAHAVQVHLQRMGS